jgi:hypothetical protein
MKPDWDFKILHLFSVCNPNRIIFFISLKKFAVYVCCANSVPTVLLNDFLASGEELL